MPVTLVGNVHYQDDPEKKIFRRVWPTIDDSELDDPQWTTLGCDPSRTAVLVKVLAGSAEANSPVDGTP